MIASAILFNIGGTQRTSFSQRYTLVIFGGVEVMVDIELFIVASYLRALGGEMRRVVTAQTHLESTCAAYCTIRVRVQIELNDLAAVGRRTPLVVVQDENDAFDRMSNENLHEIGVRREVDH